MILGGLMIGFIAYDNSQRVEHDRIAAALPSFDSFPEVAAPSVAATPTPQSSSLPDFDSLPTPSVAVEQQKIQAQNLITAQRNQAEQIKKNQELNLKIRNAIVHIKNDISTDGSKFSYVADNTINVWSTTGHMSLILRLKNNSEHDVVPPMQVTVQILQYGDVVYSKDVWINIDLPKHEARFVTIDIPEYSWERGDGQRGGNLFGKYEIKVANSLDFSGMSDADLQAASNKWEREHQ
jgi:hypothetical protein